MRNLLRRTIFLFIGLMLLAGNLCAAFADTYEFEPDGSSKNPFNPRGYTIQKGNKGYWLSSPFNNSGTMPVYTGTDSGLDFIDVEDAGLLCALTDRNPTPGKQYLIGYKNGNVIKNFSSYIGTPERANIQTSGSSTGWQIPIHLDLEAGCRYEFAFLRGMKANNGITLVFSEDGKGYIQNPSTKEEKQKYEKDKNDEYEFIVSYKKDTDPETNENHYYDFYMVPMRFTIQTYADISKWEKKAKAVQNFLDSVTKKDLSEGRYVRSNIKTLEKTLQSMNREVRESVREMLQPEANSRISAMIKEIDQLLKKAQSEKPEPSDLSELRKKIKEAEALYEKASANIGTSVGQYGSFEVSNLGDELAIAKEMDRFTPQDEVDAEVEALENAMIEVKASRVQEEQLYFYDKATGIYVIAPASSLPSDAKLFVRRMGSTSKEYQSAKKYLSKKENEAVYYQIQFYQQEFKIQPTKEVEVQIPIDAEISQNSSKIYSVGKKGRLTEINSIKSNGTQIFKTDTLKAFVMAGSTATEAEKAEARGERLAALMAQKNDDDSDNKQNQLQEDKKKKEVFRDPLNRLLKRSENNATFSNDVRKETDPIYLIVIAGVLAAAAVAMGLRGLWESRRNAGK